MKTVRRALGMHQGDFGRLFRVHVMTVSGWERGQRVPQRRHVEVIADLERQIVEGMRAMREREGDS